METLLPRIDRQASAGSRLMYSLAGATLVAYGAKRGSLLGAVLSAAGADLIARGLTGHHLYEVLGVPGYARNGGEIPYQMGVQVRESITVGVSPHTAYSYMRDFENLPRFMEHLRSVRIVDYDRSHWVARGPAGISVEWDARLIGDVPGRLISWRSEDKADVKNSGSVHFDAAPGGSGTVIHVELQYLPPAGALGAVVAKLFGEEPEIQIRSDLKRLKQVLELGEVTSTEGQPAGRPRS